MATTMNQENISIIIPKGPDETALDSLLNDLRSISNKFEIIIKSEHTRARSLNDGAKEATREYLWFLHADSQVNHACIQALKTSLAANPNALHYFDLAFSNDGPALVRLNSIGAWLRSHLLAIPFGDQGFCIHNATFKKIGGYPEDVDYGEDHIFVWRARQLGVKLQCVRSKLYTSARKYRQYGWAKLTLSYQYLWLKQAIPELIKLLRKKDL